MTGNGNRSTDPLPPIPLIEAPRGPLQLAELEIAAIPPLVATAREILPALAIMIGDKLSAGWLRRSTSPYRDEADQLSRMLGISGSYVLNLNYEWACTTGCHQRGSGEAMTLCRVLDWPLRLGAGTVVARHETAHGSYLNATWPGYIGVLTAVAPGRFAAAINQAPMAYSLGCWSLGLPIDWAVNRCRLWRQRAMPPSHLLRRAFETCSCYEDAVDMLLTQPVCAPVLFCVTGIHAHEACIIERRETDGVLHRGPGVMANHWLNNRYHGRPRPIRSQDRWRALRDLLPRTQAPFDWLQPPVLNRFTRLACEMNAAAGQLIVQGWHGPTPQTTVLNIH